MPDSGLLILDKPSGLTSFDCVRKVQRILQQRRVGHCGTLDPIAEGVLLLLFGSSTRRQEEFLGLEKQYWFRAEWGRFMDSGDRTGRCVETRSFEGMTRERLEQTTRSFLGEQWQVPPRVSAPKYKGKRLYQWARQGVEVPRPPRKISIATFDVLSCEGSYWEARVVCSRGTYIRSLVEDVAQKLETAATVDALVRERIGSYRREQALGWARLSTCTREDLLALAYA